MVEADGVAPRHPSATGMTLVELMLAVSLFSFLMGSVAGLVQWTLQLQARWGAEQAPHQGLDRAFSDLAYALESAQPLFAVPLMGGASRLELALVERTGATAQWHRVVYRLDGTTLVRETFPWSDSTLLLARRAVAQVSSLSFAFGMLNGATQAVEWVGQWDGAQYGVPRLVRVTCEVPAPASQGAITLSRVIRNPAGALPALENP